MIFPEALEDSAGVNISTVSFLLQHKHCQQENLFVLLSSEVCYQHSEAS